MVARTLILITISAAVILGFVWLTPIDVPLKAHGYTPEQIATVKKIGNPEFSIVVSPIEIAAKTGTTTVGTGTAAAAQQKPADQTASTETKPQQGTSAKPEPVAKPEPEPPARKFVATATINVRAGQGTDTDVVGQMNSGTVVTVLDDPAGDWMKVETDAVTGWVYKPLFELQP